MRPPRARARGSISIFADLDARRVIFATADRSAETVARFAADLAEHGGDPMQVSDTSSDMSSAFISGILVGDKRQHQVTLGPLPSGQHLADRRKDHGIHVLHVHSAPTPYASVGDLPR
jgi:hypothetical protein